jgi:hypothetical protein
VSTGPNCCVRGSCRSSYAGLLICSCCNTCCCRCVVMMCLHKASWCCWLVTHWEVVSLIVCVQCHLHQCCCCIVEGVPRTQVGATARQQQTIDGLEPGEGGRSRAQLLVCPHNMRSFCVKVLASGNALHTTACNPLPCRLLPLCLQTGLALMLLYAHAAQAAAPPSL